MKNAFRLFFDFNLCFVCSLLLTIFFCFPALALDFYAPFDLDLRHATIDADADGLPVGDEAGQGCDPVVKDAALWVTMDHPSDRASFRPSLSPTITLSGRIAGPDVTSVLLSITPDGSEDYSRTATISGLSWSYVWTPAAASATPYTIRVKAANHFYGRTLAGPFSVRWHESWPEGYLSSPRGGDHIQGTIPITGRARAGATTYGGYRLEYAAGTNPDAATWTAIHTSTAQVTNGTLYAGWNVSSLSDGPYVLRLVVYDSPPIYETRTHALVVVDSDTTPPAAPSALAIAGTVLSNVVRDGNTVTVTGTAPANTTLATAQIINQSAQQVKDVVSELTLHATGALWGTITLPTGMTATTLRLRVTVWDAAGNVSPEALSNTLMVDNAPPTLTIEIPYASAPFGLGPVIVSGTAADSGAAGLDKVEFSPDGLAWFSATGLEQWRYDWTPTAAGAYTLRVRALDALGNTVTQTRAITIYDNWPIAYITTPEHNETVQEGTVVSIIGTATHPVPANFSAYTVQYYFDNAWTLIASGNTVKQDELLAFWDTEGLNAGIYTLRLQAGDDVGNIVTFYQDVEIYNPVTLMGLPDAVLNEDETRDNFVHLPDYCVAVSGDPETFTYTIVGNTQPNCGISIDASRNLDILPVQNWHGVSTVTIEASDGVNANLDDFTVTVGSVNDAPTAPAVAITPLEPYKDENLTCTVTAASVDVDGDPVQYTYSWHMSYNHVNNYGAAVRIAGPTSALSDTLDASFINELELWKCVVTPTDGTLSGEPGVAVRRIASPAEFAPFELDLRHTTIDADGDGLPVGDEAGQECDPDIADAALWVTLDAPSRDASFISAPIALSGCIGSADVTSVLLSFDGGANYIATATLSGLAWQYSWTPAAQGTYAIMVKATNRFYGFTTEGPVNVSWQAGKPVAMITAPVHGSHITGVVNITGSALACPTGFSQYILDYKAGETPAAPGAWTVIGTHDTQVNNGVLHGSWNTGSLADGAHVLRLRVYDGPAVQMSESWITMIIDRNVVPPAVPGPLLIGGAVLPSVVKAGGIVNIMEGSWAPANCRVESAQILNTVDTPIKDVKNNIVLHASGAVRGSFTLPTPCDTVSVKLALTVRDAVGNISTGAGESNPLTVDNAGPTVAITHPPDNALIRQEAISVSGTAADAGPAGVASVALSTDNVQFTSASGTANWSYSWTPETTGDITLYVRATDALGTIGVTSSIIVTVSATNPAAYIASPMEGDTIGEGTLVPVTGTAKDTDFQNYLLQYQKVGTGTWVNITASPVTMPVSDGLLATWDTTGRDNGDHLLRLTVTDGAAHVSTFDRLVTLVADLTLAGLPDAPPLGETFFENTTRLHHAYLPDYVVPSVGAENFTYRLAAPLPPVGAGVAINGLWIDITPQQYWFGVTDVVVEVEDLSGHINQDTFRVTVTKVNDAPTTPEVAIEPAMPGDDDALACMVVTPATDLDGDPVQYQYDWYSSVNGVTFTPSPVRSVRVPSDYDVLAASQTEPGEFWKCIVRAYDGAVYSSGSFEDTVRVLQSSTISMGLSSQNITLGQYLTVSGQINGLLGSAPVLFTSTLPTGMVDETYPAGVLSANSGVYSLNFPPKLASEGRAPWQIQASWNGDSAYRGAQSVIMAFTVNKAQPNLLLTLSHTSALVNLEGATDFEISASLIVSGFPVELQSLLAGRTVRLSVQTPDGQTPWAPLEAVTDASGAARFDKAAFDAAGITFNEAGVWRFRAAFDGDENLKSAATEDFASTTARLTIKEGAGYAVLVLGRLDEFAEGHAEHAQTTDYIYSVLRGRNFVDEDIYYLREFLPGEIDRGYPVDGAATAANLQYAIETWASNKMLASPAPLYLILVNHGSPGVFYMDIGGTGPVESITAADLDGWLSVLQSALGQTKASAADQDITVVYGACYSGSFIPVLSGTKRILITSSAADEIAYRGVINSETGLRDGDFFLTEFFRNAGEGRTLKDAFELACFKTYEYTATRTGSNAVIPQHPQLDDNADGMGTTGYLSTTPGLDGALVAGMDLGLGANAGNGIGWFTALPPVTLLPGGTLPDGLWAEATGRDLLPGDTAWIEIKTPAYNDGTVATEGYEDYQRVAALVGPIACTAVPEDLGGGRTRFTWSQADLETQLTEGFTTPGTYKAYYFLRDGETGQVGAYLVTNVYVSQSGNQPPPAVELLYPDDEGTVNATLFLAWTESVDPNADVVTYRVEVSEDPLFPTESTIVRDGLSDTVTTLSTADGILNDHDYYWRVIPTDPYGATPEENELRRFLVRGSPGVPGAITGKVTVLGTLVGVTGATLTLTPTSQTGVSTGTGAYFLGDVSQGVYNLAVSAPGYVTAQHTGVIVTSGRYTTLNVPLEPELVNHAPVWTPIGDKWVIAGRLLSFQVAASDIDLGQTLIYTTSSLPTGATFDPAIRMFTWTPVMGQVRMAPYEVTFTVTDDGDPALSAETTIGITVDRGAYISGPGHAEIGSRVELEYHGEYQPGLWHVQWDHDGTAIPDQTEELLVIESVELDDAGWYTATQVSDTKADPVSANFYLNVVEAVPVKKWCAGLMFVVLLSGSIFSLFMKPRYQ